MLGNSAFDPATLPGKGSTQSRSSRAPLDRDDQEGELMGAAVSKSARRISAEGAGAGSVGGLDLQGQAASESDGHRHISGTGGQLQFIRGAYTSNGGKSFLCMSSTCERNGDRPAGWC
jgi:Acetyl-CoA hydrolase/transferase C-terminal domain